MTTAQPHPIVKRRKIDTVFLGAIGQSEESHHPGPSTTNSNAHDVRNSSDLNQPSTSTSSSNGIPTNFANFGRCAAVVKRTSAEMAPPFRPSESATNSLMSAGNSLQEFPGKTNGVAVEAELRNSSLAMDSSTGGELSMDSDVFAMSVAKASSKANACEVEQSEIPEISEAVRILQRPIPPETKFNRLDAKTATIIESIPTVQKEISVQLKRRNDCTICEVQAFSSSPVATTANKGLLKCGRICARAEHIGVLWEIVVKAGVTLLRSKHDWTVAACENRELVIIRTKTGKLQRTLRFESPIVIVLLHENICLVILANAELVTCNLETGESIVQTSLACVLRTPDSKISHYAVTDRGVPMILASNEECVVYSRGMGAWLTVNVGVDPVSSVVEPMKFMTRIAPNGLIALLAEQKPTEKVNFNPETNASCEEMQFEALLEACKAIESWVEFRFLLQIYAQKLMSRGKREKLVETLEEIRKASHSELHFDKVLEDIDVVLREYSTNYEKLVAESGEDCAKNNFSFID